MLKLTWSPDLTKTSDPDADAYKAAVDTLVLGDGGAQTSTTFARPWPRAVQPVSGEFAQAIGAWLDRQGERPITLMVHGFAFDPTHPKDNPGDDPYRLIYGSPADGTHPRLSWLPIVGECDDQGRPGDGAAIAFAWLSETDVLTWINAGWNNPYLMPAFDLAPLAAQALAAVIAVLQDSGRAFRILAHSLGTRTTCQAIGYLRYSSHPWKPGTLKRIILMDGAEYLVDANRNLPGAGLGYEVFNIVNRQDLVLSWLAHAGSYPVRPRDTAPNSDRVIGYEGLKKTDGWLDIQIDRQDVQDWIQTHGGMRVTGIAPKSDNAIHSLATWNHWICYMDGVGAPDGGNRAFLRRLLDLSQPGMAWFDGAGFPSLKDGHYVDEFYYGNFNPAIPDTPMTIPARKAQADPAVPLPPGLDFG